MKKIKLSTEGLTGNDLKFVEMLNLRFADAPETPELATDENKLKEFIQLQVRAATKGMIKEDGTSTIDWAKADKIDFDKLGGVLADKGENSIAEIRSALTAQGKIINGLKELGEGKPSGVLSIRDQIKDYFDKNKDKLEAFKSGESKQFGTRQSLDTKIAEAGIELQTRAAVTMTVATQSGGSAFMPQVDVMPGLVDIARSKPFIEQYANTGTTNRPRIVWTEKYNKQGQAAFIAEGAVKPLISFEWRSFESYAKKVADKIKVSSEALDDVDWMAAEIEYELKWEVDIRVDVELLTGAGDGTNGATTLKGLVSYIGGYVLTSIKTTTPNNFDALRAAYAQIISLFFAPTHVFIHPIDAANMDLVKNTQGTPIAINYRALDGRIFRIQPIETTQMPVGYFLMGDMSRFKVRNYKPFAMYLGWVNDDFERNLVTIIGERRLHSFVAANDIGGFIYDTFANVKTNITQP